MLEVLALTHASLHLSIISFSYDINLEMEEEDLEQTWKDNNIVDFDPTYRKYAGDAHYTAEPRCKIEGQGLCKGERGISLSD